MIPSNHLLLYVLSLVSYALSSTLCDKVDRHYRTMLSLGALHKTTFWASHVVTMLLVFLFWNASMARLPNEVIISFSIAGAVLRSIWIIDRACLLIPDRLQLLGLVSALSFLGIQLYFGAHWDEAFLEIGFAIGQVALLWLLSIAYFKLRKTIGFGMGDIKLLSWIAIFAGQRLTYIILGAIGLGILTLAVVSIKNSIQNKKLTIPSGTDAFAFGPQIIAALAIDGILFNG